MMCCQRFYYGLLTVFLLAVSAFGAPTEVISPIMPPFTDQGRPDVAGLPATGVFDLESSRWLANSDRRLKRDITPLTGGLETILRLNPVRYRYTADYLKKHPAVKDQYYYNFIAQDYQQVFPEATITDGDGFLMIDTHPAQIALVAAVQELARAVREKDAVIAALQGEVRKLTERDALLTTHGQELTTLKTSLETADAARKGEISALKTAVDDAARKQEITDLKTTIQTLKDKLAAVETADNRELTQLRDAVNELQRQLKLLVK